MISTVWLTSVRMWSVSGPFKVYGTTGSIEPAIPVASTGHSSPMIYRSVASFAPTAVLEFCVCWCLFSSGVRGMAVLPASGPEKGEEQQQKVVKNLCSWQLQSHSLLRVDQQEMYGESCLTRSLEVYWRDVVEASYKYSTTAQSVGRSARQRAHHPRGPEALIVSMTKTLSTFTGTADEMRECNTRRQQGQLLNSSLLEYTNLLSLEHQGVESVLHLGESRRFISFSPEHEETCDHVPVDCSLGGSFSWASATQPCRKNGSTTNGGTRQQVRGRVCLQGRDAGALQV